MGSGDILNQFDNIRVLLQRRSNKKYLENTKTTVGEIESDASALLDTLKESIPKGAHSTLVSLYDSLLNPPPKDEKNSLPSGQFPTPVPYNQDVYAAILPYAKFMYELEDGIGIPEEHAYKLAAIFDTPIKALSYLKALQKTKDLKTLMHDANLFVLPQGKCHWKTWKKLTSQNLTNLPFRKTILPNASVLEKAIRAEAKDEKVDAKIVSRISKEVEKIRHDYKKLYRRRGYLTDEEEENLLQLSDDLEGKQLELMLLGVPFSNQLSLEVLRAHQKKYFKESNPVYRYFLENGLTEHDYEKFKALERLDDDTLIPNITIGGTDIDAPGYYLMKIPVTDEMHAARAACLGKLTNCCQSLSGEAGEPCAIHGLTSANGGFYVVCKGDVNNPNVSDKIIGQSWTWRSKSGALVFDSIEISDFTDENLVKIVKEFYQTLGRELVINNHTDKVACGKSSGISSEVGIKAVNAKVETFKDYNNYCDSVHQLTIYNKNAPFYQYGQSDEDNEATHVLIEESLKSDIPYGKNQYFAEMVNWALRPNNKSLLKKIGSIAKELNKKDDFMFFIRQTKQFMNRIDREDFDSCLDLLEEGAYIDTVNRHGNTLLSSALDSDETQIAIKLLDMGADPNSSYDDYSALEYAKKIQNSKLILKLIDKGAIFNPANILFDEELVLAPEIFDALVAQGARTDVKDENDLTPAIRAKTHNCNYQFGLLDEDSESTLTFIKDALISDIPYGTNQDFARMINWAILNEKESFLRKIKEIAIEQGKETEFDSFQTQTKELVTNLGWSKQHGDNCLKLIEEGAYIETINDRGHTFLFSALSSRNGLFAEKLLDMGADPNAPGTDKSALEYAKITRDAIVTLKLIEKGATFSPIKILFDKNILRTPQILAALVAKGADINALESDGLTPLMYEALRYDSSLLDDFIKHGAQVSTKNPEGKTALMLRVEAAVKRANQNFSEVFNKNTLKIIGTLTAHKANINDKDNDGCTALILAVKSVRNQYEFYLSPDCKKSTLEILTTLGRHNADINAKDDNGETALMLAVKGELGNKHPEFALKLIEMGADIKIKDSSGKTALDYISKELISSIKENVTVSRKSRWGVKETETQVQKETSIPRKKN